MAEETLQLAATPQQRFDALHLADQIKSQPAELNRLIDDVTVASATQAAAKVRKQMH